MSFLGLGAAGPGFSVWAPTAALSEDQRGKGPRKPPPTPGVQCCLVRDSMGLSLCLPLQRGSAFLFKDTLPRNPHFPIPLSTHTPRSWHSPQRPNGPQRRAECGQISKAGVASSHPTAGTSLPASSSTGFSFGIAQPTWGCRVSREPLPEASTGHRARSGREGWSWGEGGIIPFSRRLSLSVIHSPAVSLVRGLRDALV